MQALRAGRTARAATRRSSSRGIAEKQRLAIEEASGDLGAALGVGGFSNELQAVVRRVLASRPAS